MFWFRMAGCGTGLAVALWVAIAAAQAQPAEDEQPTASSVAGAPEPGTVSGMVEHPPPPSRLRWIPRVVLFVPRLAIEIVDAPIRGFLWAYERYALRQRAKSIFFNDEGTLGVYPVALVETGFGLNIGGRLIARDLFDKEEGLRLRASYGGRFSQLYSAKLGTGRRIPGVELELNSELELRPKDRFYGFGNVDESDSAMGADPRARDVAALTRYRQTVGRVALGGRIALGGPFYLQPNTAFRYRSFSNGPRVESGGVIEETFDTVNLPGYASGVQQSYSELEFGIDNRRAARFEPDPAYSDGWLAAAFLGYARDLEEGRGLSYGRYGVDLQQFLRIGPGPRSLALRLYGESVIGRLDQVPFAELPTLGGPILLRGYDFNRFHDRALVLGSAEYFFDLAQNIGTAIYVDSGRVLPSFQDITTDDLRLGFGAALQLHTKNSFLARASLSSSKDGGLFFHLSFDPVYDTKARVERK